MRLAHGASLAALLALLAALSAPPVSRADQAPIAIGAYVPNQWNDPSLIDEYASQVGRMPAIVLAYKRWDVKPFYEPELTQIWKRGAIAMISWEPWLSDGTPRKLFAIARGRFDGYITRSAEEAKEWGKPVLLRFAQEMNGAWAPWEQGREGSTPRAYRLAWKHIVEIFREVGAENVIWVWCPNVNTGHLPFMQYYPGDEWVDWVGLDGFNWGGTIGWRSFSEIFAGSYEELARQTSKPILVGETGSGQTGGDKAEWVRSVFQRELPNFGDRLRAVVWFNSEDRADFRVASSESALAAFREGVAMPRYAGTRADLLATPARMEGPVAEIPIPSGGFGAPPWYQHLWERLEGRLGRGGALAVVVGAALLALAAAVTIFLWWRRRRRRAGAAG